MKKPYLKKNSEQGFTLVEFIVVLVIFSIMSGTSLFNYNRYQNNIETTNIAQDIALTIRQAQVYGISAASETLPQINNSNDLNLVQDKSIRGFAINTESQEIILFEDLNRSFGYESQSDRIIDVRRILARNTNISACLFDFGASPIPGECSVDVASESTMVNVVFQRPYPDAFINFDGNSYGHVLVELKDNSANNLKYIEINPIGNISVKSYE